MTVFTGMRYVSGTSGHDTEVARTRSVRFLAYSHSDTAVRRELQLRCGANICAIHARC